MQPLYLLSLTIMCLLITGVTLHTYLFSNIYGVLFAWLWFNLWIAFYEIYIVYQRKTLTKEKCQPGFWSKDTNWYSFWKDAWNEYTCYSDTRYLNPNDFVFIIELINAILVILLWFAILNHNIFWIYILLFIQAYHCCIYFISLWHSQKINNAYPLKLYGYLAISALWIMIPIYTLSRSVILA
jgi:hypothetical protein